MVIWGGGVCYERGTPVPRGQRLAVGQRSNRPPRERSCATLLLLLLSNPIVCEPHDEPASAPPLTGVPHLRTPPGPYRRPVHRVQGEFWGGGRFLMGEVPLYAHHELLPRVATAAPAAPNNKSTSKCQTGSWADASRSLSPHSRPLLSPPPSPPPPPPAPPSQPSQTRGQQPFPGQLLMSLDFLVQGRVACGPAWEATAQERLPVAAPPACRVQGLGFRV